MSSCNGISSAAICQVSCNLSRQLQFSSSADIVSEASSCNFLPTVADTAISRQSSSQVQFTPLRQQTACAYVSENKQQAVQWANSTHWLRQAAKQIAATYTHRAFFTYIYASHKFEKHHVAA